MKLEVGQYIRTKKGIGKIENIEEDRTEIHFNCDNGLSLGFVKRGFTQEEMANMFEHNYNIIELVKIGDYVNGVKVTGNLGYLLSFEDDEWFMTEEEIKSIVTKEQFESMVYKVV